MKDPALRDSRKVARGDHERDSSDAGSRMRPAITRETGE
jgi:hypothetical protein